MLSALEVYSAGLRDAWAGDPRPLRLRVAGAEDRELPLAVWLGPLTPADEDALARARGPVLDIGCGPGRHVHALARCGVLALGLDVSPTAVWLARDRGARVMRTSIFGRVPGAGRWRTALLLDGNIGIGGRPHALLGRVRELLAEGGEALVELDGPGVGIRSSRARLAGPLGVSASFPWASVGPEAIGAVARGAGFEVAECWSAGGRQFARLAAIERVPVPAGGPRPSRRAPG